MSNFLKARHEERTAAQDASSKAKTKLQEHLNSIVSQVNEFYASSVNSVLAYSSGGDSVMIEVNRNAALRMVIKQSEAGYVYDVQAPQNRTGNEIDEKALADLILDNIKCGD